MHIFWGITVLRISIFLKLCLVIQEVFGLHWCYVECSLGYSVTMCKQILKWSDLLFGGLFCFLIITIIHYWISLDLRNLSHYMYIDVELCNARRVLKWGRWAEWWCEVFCFSRMMDFKLVLVACSVYALSDLLLDSYFKGEFSANHYSTKWLFKNLYEQSEFRLSKHSESP